MYYIYMVLWMSYENFIQFFNVLNMKYMYYASGLVCEHACVKDPSICNYPDAPFYIISKTHSYYTITSSMIIIIIWLTPNYITHTWLHCAHMITLLQTPSTIHSGPYHAVIILHTLTQIMFKQSVLIRKLWGRRRARRWGTRHLHLCLKWGEHGIKLIQWGVHVWHLLVQMYPKH